MNVLSPRAKGGGYPNSLFYAHSSWVRTVQDIFGLNLEKAVEAHETHQTHEKTKKRRGSFLTRPVNTSLGSNQLAFGVFGVFRGLQLPDSG